MSKQMMESGASGLELELRCFATFCHTRVRKKNLKEHQGPQEEPTARQTQSTSRYWQLITKAASTSATFGTMQLPSTGSSGACEM